MARKEHRLTEIFRSMESYERPADMRELLIHQGVCEDISENVSPEHVRILPTMEDAWEYAFGGMVAEAQHVAEEALPPSVVAFIVREPDRENKRMMLENVEHLYDYVTVADPANELDELHVLVER